jgi:hypothetical protein
MSATKFCPSCGETIKRNLLSPFGFVLFCRRCRKHSRVNSIAPLALLGCCMLLGFFIGRLTTPRQPFTFIGTPIELQTKRNSSPNPSSDNGNANFNQRPNTGESANSAAEEILSMCGAPTKSGRPCRRKVRGGGYCWQHKDKQKTGASTVQQNAAPHTRQ